MRAALEAAAAVRLAAAPPVHDDGEIKRLRAALSEIYHHSDDHDEAILKARAALEAGEQADRLQRAHAPTTTVEEHPSRLPGSVVNESSAVENDRDYFVHDEHQAQDGWRDIASAPKDRFIFVYCPEDGSRWLAMWQSDQWYGVDEQGLTRSSNHWRVAHWRPLPEPPAAPKGSAND